MLITISPIDIGIPSTGGWRTPEEQHDLFVRGLSKCDGYTKLSKHQSGRAVDIFAYLHGKASWDKEHLAIIAGVVLSVANQKGIPIRWGGTFGSDDFKGWDYPHFEFNIVKSKKMKRFIILIFLLSACHKPLRYVSLKEAHNLRVRMFRK